MTSQPAVQISPSVLPADFARLGDEIKTLEAAGADRIHWDVMDGRFVPNLTFGPDVIASTRELVSIPFEAHLMVEEPQELAHRYAEAGCDLVMVHEEACIHLHRTLGMIQDLGIKAGVVLNPSTPADVLSQVLDLCSQVLVMTVNPGFGGQKHIATMAPKIAQLAQMIGDGGHDCELEVDGGVSNATIAPLVQAGATVFVAGSALFKDPEGLEHAIKDLRTAGEAAL